MDKGTRIMVTSQELDRIVMIKNVLSKKVTQREVADDLCLSTRQIKRLVRRYRASGEEGLICVKRGGNRAFSSAFKEQVMCCIRIHYADFKPTFAADKLAENKTWFKSSEHSGHFRGSVLADINIRGVFIIQHSPHKIRLMLQNIHSAETNYHIQCSLKEALFETCPFY